MTVGAVGRSKFGPTVQPKRAAEAETNRKAGILLAARTLNALCY
jgi:hypothetical protein